MTNTTNLPRHVVVGALLDRASVLLAEGDQLRASLAADVMATSFCSDDAAYDGEYMLSGDHGLAASVDAAALAIAEYIFSACNYKNLAAQTNVVARDAIDKAFKLVPSGS